MGRQDHWQAVYTSKGENDVSWFQERPSTSLDLIALAGATAISAIIDIGGGASRLVDALVAKGFGAVSVLDLSEAAVKTAKTRMGSEADKVTWIVADVTIWQPEGVFDIWHDRAAFHFLTDENDRAAYISRLTAALKPGGHAIIATFAPDGPEKCSGLPVMRYDAESLGRTLGSAFKLVEARREAHVTPWNSVQQFQFSLFRRAA
jgi:trans-aconitate methyltransferase